MDGGLSAAFFSSATRNSANAPALLMEGDAEDFVAHLEPFHARPDGFDHACEIMAQAARKPEPGKHLHFRPGEFSSPSGWLLQP
jgi:hypothetical protein